MKGNNVDPIVLELTEKSRIIPINRSKSKVIAIGIDGKPPNIPMMRGGKIEGYSLVFKNQRIFFFVKTLCDKKRSQRIFKLLGNLIAYTLGLRITAGGSMDYTQFILFCVPSTLGGFIVGTLITNPLLVTIFPLMFLYTRGIENVIDPSEKCRVLCKVAEEFHNRKLALEMKEITSFIDNTVKVLEFPA
jgi:hypothetical protein